MGMRWPFGMATVVMGKLEFPVAGVTVGPAVEQVAWLNRQVEAVSSSTSTAIFSLSAASFMNDSILSL
jgi:hypothetical protein